MQAPQRLLLVPCSLPAIPQDRPVPPITRPSRGHHSTPLFLNFYTILGMELCLLCSYSQQGCPCCGKDFWGNGAILTDTLSKSVLPQSPHPLSCATGASQLVHTQRLVSIQPPSICNSICISHLATRTGYHRALLAPAVT